MPTVSHAPHALDPAALLRTDSTAPRLRDYPRGVPVVYLIHLSAPLGHARHYVGWSSNLRGRLYQHARGLAHSCAFLRAVRDAGIRWRLVRVWAYVDRVFERKIKDDAQVARLCPVCRVKALRRNAKAVRIARQKRKDALCPAAA